MAWEHALDMLPRDRSECTDAQAELVQYCLDGLMTSVRALKKMEKESKKKVNTESNCFLMDSMEGEEKWPWQRAFVMLDQVRDNPKASSVSILSV